MRFVFRPAFFRVLAWFGTKHRRPRPLPPGALPSPLTPHVFLLPSSSFLLARSLRLVLIGTQLPHLAGGALGSLGVTDPAAVVLQDVTELDPVRLGHDLHQLRLDLVRIAL